MLAAALTFNCRLDTLRPMRGDKTKIPVIAIVQRAGGKVVSKVLPNVSADEITAVIKKHVLPGSVIYTDEYPSYKRIQVMKGEDGSSLRYKHFQIRHKRKVYVQGHVHTNSVDGFWSLLKRGISGVYHSVSPKYLQTYLDEYGFRYNHRFEGNKQFKSILQQVSRKAS